MLYKRDSRHFQVQCQLRRSQVELISTKCYSIIRINYSGTLVLIVNLFQNSWRVPKPTSTERWSIFSCGAASWLIRILVWWVLSKPGVLKHFFLIKMRWVQGLMSSEANKYWGMTLIYNIPPFKAECKYHGSVLFCFTIYVFRCCQNA